MMTLWNLVEAVAGDSIALEFSRNLPPCSGERWLDSGGFHVNPGIPDVVQNVPRNDLGESQRMAGEQVLKQTKM